MIRLELTNGQAVLLQNVLATAQGAVTEDSPVNATQVLEMRLVLSDAMAKVQSSACRLVLSYDHEELHTGQLPAESSVEMHFNTKAEAAAVMMQMGEASKQYPIQPTKPRNYVLHAEPGQLVSEIKGL